MSLKSVKSKIKSIDKTRQVTKAMEAVSAVKMRKSQQQALAARPYATGAFSILKTISQSGELGQHELLTDRPIRNTLLIVVSSDKGLAGSYGSTILKSILRFLAANKLDAENSRIVTIGKKAYEFFDKRGYTIIHSQERMSDGVKFDDIHALRELVLDAFLSHDVDQVYILYTNFISTLRQEVVHRKLLPLSTADIGAVIESIVPKTGLYSERRKIDTPELLREPVFEPNIEHVAQVLFPKLFSIQLYHSILEANASEHSARMIAMKNASDNAKEISRLLKLKFNKVRQAAITKEVSEIVGGMESMKTND